MGWFSKNQAKKWNTLSRRLAVTGDAVASEYKSMKELRWHEYLEQERKLPRSVLLSPRFRGRIHADYKRLRINHWAPSYQHFCGNAVILQGALYSLPADVQFPGQQMNRPATSTAGVRAQRAIDDLMLPEFTLGASIAPANCPTPTAVNM